MRITDHSTPVRIVHLGLGAFHKAHQAWHTRLAEKNPLHPEWGIAAFTGRSPAAAVALEAQGCVYTLVERGPESDTLHEMRQIVAAHPADDLDAFARYLSSPQVAIVTMTVTEAGYHLTPSRELIEDAAVGADIRLLADAWNGERLARRLQSMTTAMGRLIIGLDARRLAAAGPLTLVPCDNLAQNGEAAAAALRGMAQRLAEEADGAEVLSSWIRDYVRIASTSIDRITPRRPAGLHEELHDALGWEDRCAEITEPYSSWIIQGEFPAGRPAWEQGGVVFTENVLPFERRKLWLLNGAHTLLAAAGLRRGYETVAQAIDAPDLRCLVENFWNEAGAYLTGPELNLEAYRADLLLRFRNARIEHRLEQISQDATFKMAMRIAPVARAEREAGRPAAASAAVFAEWIQWQGGDVVGLVETVDPTLVGDQEFISEVEKHVRQDVQKEEK